MADRIGRKPVILGGILGLGVSVASFGMSKSFLAMVLSRCIGGALGGVWACTKVMVGEMTDRSNQASAFQWMQVSQCVRTYVVLRIDDMCERSLIVLDKFLAFLSVGYLFIQRAVRLSFNQNSGMNIPSLCLVSLLQSLLCVL